MIEKIMDTKTKRYFLCVNGDIMINTQNNLEFRRLKDNILLFYGNDAKPRHSDKFIKFEKIGNIVKYLGRELKQIQEKYPEYFI